MASSIGNRDSNNNDDVSAEELKRQRRRKQLARKTPEQRRKMLQYSRRHNERDGRLFYCDYCDLFISSAQRVWQRHLASAKHMANVEGYWHMAAHVEAPWLNEVNENVAKAQLQALHRRQQAVAGSSAATPMPAMRVAAGIVVGGTVAHNGRPLAPAAPVSIKVGNTVISPPPAKAAKGEPL